MAAAAAAANADHLRLVAGRVTSVRRHGRNLTFCCIGTDDEADGRERHPTGDEVELVFRGGGGAAAFDSDSLEFGRGGDGCCSPTKDGGPRYRPFPCARGDVGVGDAVRAWVTEEAAPPSASRPTGVGVDLCVVRWELVERTRPDSKGGGAPASPTAGVATEEGSASSLSTVTRGRRHRHGRRKGAAASAGFLPCPLCPPSSHRMYSRGAGGFRQHLRTVHGALLPSSAAGATSTDGDANDEDEAWYREVEARAIRQHGVFASRGGGIAGGGRNGRRSRRSKNENMEIPGSTSAEGAEGAADVVGAYTVDHPGLVAARNGDVETLSRMLEGDYDWSDGDGWGGFRPFAAESLDRNGASALDWAAGGGQLECVRLLLPYADGVNVCRSDGRGPAHWAARRGRVDVLRFLLGHSGKGCGASVDSRTMDGTTMLMLACYGGHVPETADLIVELGADVGARNGWGCDAGHFAAMGGSVAACRWAQGRGLELNRPQDNGHTPLHKAAEKGEESVIRWLLGEGLSDADVERTRERMRMRRLELGGTGAPSLMARRGGHRTCVELLEQHGL